MKLKTTKHAIATALFASGTPTLRCFFDDSNVSCVLHVLSIEREDGSGRSFNVRTGLSTTHYVTTID